MDTTRTGTGEMIAAGGGVVLLLSLFLDWFGDASGWQAFRLIDIVLLLIAVLVVGLVAARAAGTQLAADSVLASALAGAGAVALVVSVAFLFEGISLDIGVFLAVLASAAIAYGGWRSMGATPSQSTAGRSGAGPAAGPSDRPSA